MPSLPLVDLTEQRTANRSWKNSNNTATKLAKLPDVELHVGTSDSKFTVSSLLEHFAFAL